MQQSAAHVSTSTPQRSRYSAILEDMWTSSWTGGQTVSIINVNRGSVVLQSLP